MHEIELFGNTYQYKYFFDIETQTEGIEIFLNGERLGSALIDLPDFEDEESMNNFESDFMDWVIDNVEDY